jgi:hypothetical protein
METAPVLVARTILVLIHLVFFALALATVLQADWQFLRNRLPSRRRLRSISRHTAWWFLGLLVSGAALVWIDTGFELQRMAANPKLLVKLSVVAVLGLNGCLLHGWGLGALQRPSSQGRRVAAALALMGAVSSASWLMATMVGVGRPLVPMLGYSGFMALYAAVLVVAAAVSMLWMRPLLVRRLQGPATSFDTAPGALQALRAMPAKRADRRRLAA